MAAQEAGRSFNTFLMSDGLLLITRLFPPVSPCSVEQLNLAWIRHGRNMNDVIYIGITVLFFVISGLYVRFCEKL